MSVKQLVQLKNNMDCDFYSQRNLVWNKYQKSLLIHTLMINYPCPAFYFQKQSDNHYIVIDGQQRINAIISYIEGKYPLTDNTPDVDINFLELKRYSVANKYFKDLDKELQDAILTFMITIKTLEGFEEIELNEIIRRLNNGTAFTKTEKARVEGYKTLKPFIEKLLSSEFFKRKLNMNVRHRTLFSDEKIIYYILILELYPQYSFYEEAVLTIAKKIEDNDKFDRTMQQTILNTFEYLNDAFPAKDTYLTTTNVPFIYMIAKQAIHDNVEHKIFSGVVQKFFNEIDGNNKYKQLMSKNRLTKSEIDIKLSEIIKYYNENVNSCEPYKIDLSSRFKNIKL
jgi:hypothetical protein